MTGYKTYVVAALGIIYAVAGFLTGHVDGNSAIEVILAALGAAGLRSGINTAIAQARMPQ